MQHGDQNMSVRRLDVEDSKVGLGGSGEVVATMSMETTLSGRLDSFHLPRLRHEIDEVYKNEPKACNPQQVS